MRNLMFLVIVLVSILMSCDLESFEYAQIKSIPSDTIKKNPVKYKQSSNNDYYRYIKSFHKKCPLA